jgi:hypothetical protein
MQHGAELENRQAKPRGHEVVEADLRRVKGERTPMAARLEAARQMRPPKESCCGHCWATGRDAVIRALETAAE